MVRRLLGPYLVMALAGILSAVYFGITHTVWAVTGEFTVSGTYSGIHRGGCVGLGVFRPRTYERNDLDADRRLDRMGHVYRALITILLSGNFKIRMPRQKRRYVQGFAGGIIAGFGARLALGAISRPFTGVPQFSLHSWIFIVATGAGTFLGARLVNTRWWKGKPVLKMGGTAPSVKPGRTGNPYSGVCWSCLHRADRIFLRNWSHDAWNSRPFRSGIRYSDRTGPDLLYFRFPRSVDQRPGYDDKSDCRRYGSQLCRYTYRYSCIRSGPDYKIAAPSTFIGGLLFGLGIVMAGGCETGMMYRLMEGQVVFYPCLSAI